MTIFRATVIFLHAFRAVALLEVFLPKYLYVYVEGSRIANVSAHLRVAFKIWVIFN
jgi:hypothetical protein